MTVTNLRKRFERAIEGLTKGTYTVEGPRKIGSGYEWTVINANTTYNVFFNKDTGFFCCECPDFVKRGGICKHMIMVRIVYDLRHDLKHSPIDELLDTARVEELWHKVVQMAQRYAEIHVEAAPSTPPAPEPTRPTPSPDGNSNGDKATDKTDQSAPAAPEAIVLPWGKYKGKTLGELTTAKEGLDYLLWLAKKWEPREDSDPAEAERLKQTARSVLEAWASAQADAVMDGRIPWPVVPFGEDKGKPLGGPGACHPKWVAILAKKSFDDAFKAGDLVLYEVARRIKQRFSGRSRGRRGGSGGGNLSDEAARELAAAIRELAAELREQRNLEKLEEVLRNAISRGVSQATVHHLPLHR